MATTTTRDLVHHLIDELPDALLEEAGRRLTDLRDDRFLRAFLEAPEKWSATPWRRPRRRAVGHGETSGSK